MGLLDTLRSWFGGSKPAQPARPSAPTATAPPAPAQAGTTPAAEAATGAAAATSPAVTSPAVAAPAATGDRIHAAALALVGPDGSELPTLVEKLRAGDLHEVVGVWLDTGDNMPVSPGGLTKALGADKIAEIADSLGLPQDEVAAGLAKELPEIIDKLTPEGFVPDAEGLRRNYRAQFGA